MDLAYVLLREPLDIGTAGAATRGMEFSKNGDDRQRVLPLLYHHAAIGETDSSAAAVTGARYGVSE